MDKKYCVVCGSDLPEKHSKVMLKLYRKTPNVKTVSMWGVCEKHADKLEVGTVITDIDFYDYDPS